MNPRNILFYNLIPNNREAFANEVLRISANLGVPPGWLMFVMWIESRLNPKAKNPYGTAVGLIQFTADTAKRLGTTTNELLVMDNVTQLRYVEKYLMPYRGKFTSVGDLYLTIFYPVAVNKPDTYNLPLSAYWVNANKIFDLNGDGVIKVGEIRSYVKTYYDKQKAAEGNNLVSSMNKLPMVLPFFFWLG